MPVSDQIRRYWIIWLVNHLPVICDLKHHWCYRDACRHLEKMCVCVGGGGGGSQANFSKILYFTVSHSSNFFKFGHFFFFGGGGVVSGHLSLTYQHSFFTYLLTYLRSKSHVDFNIVWVKLMSSKCKYPLKSERVLFESETEHATSRPRGLPRQTDIQTDILLT